MSFQSATHALSHHLQQSANTTHNLIVADEGLDITGLPELDNAIQLVTNRFDAHQTAVSNGIDSLFSDFDFSQIDKRIHTWYYRISKERPVCHHILNAARKLLPKNGKLIISGKKNEGIKTYAQALVKNLGFSGQLNKHGDVYLGEFILNDPNASVSWLDDKQYSQLRDVTPKNSQWRFRSKPGTFGWNKVDQGSQLLMDWFTSQLPQFKEQKFAPHSVLDLGCGYGYLSLRFLRECVDQLGISSLYATDNNAAAILSCSENLKHSIDVLPNTAINVSADDCAKNIDKKFDLILCNPPFHQGFDNSRPLSEKFIKSCSTHLTPNGRAYLVVNRFIPVERIASVFFSDVKEVSFDGQFRVVCLKHL